MRPPDYRRIRHPEDHEPIRSFLERRQGDGGLVTLSENKLIGLAEHPSGFIAERDGHISGLVALNRASAAGEFAMEIVAPTGNGIVAGLVSVAENHVRSVGGDRLRWWMYDEPGPVLAERLGYVPERQLLLMERGLPTGRSPRFPEGVEVRGFEVGEDEDVWLGVNNAAFAGHPENGGWGRAELSNRLAAPWFDAEGFRMAWEGDELVGFCWTKVHPDQSGEIYVIAASPDHWGRDLGRQLVLEGLRYLGEQGCPRAILYTEGDNERAIELYGGLGFEIARTHRSYLKTLQV